MLVRWFAGHHDAWDRDSLCRPVCPGPLASNHCLWTYAKSSLPRRIMTSTDGSPSTVFKNNAWMFGRGESTRIRKWEDEQYAYYGLISPSTILNTTNMSREYDASSMIHTDTWLETVTVN